MTISSVARFMGARPVAFGTSVAPPSSEKPAADNYLQKIEEHDSGFKAAYTQQIKATKDSEAYDTASQKKIKHLLELSKCRSELAEKLSSGGSSSPKLMTADLKAKVAVSDAIKKLTREEAAELLYQADMKRQTLLDEGEFRLKALGSDPTLKPTEDNINLSAEVIQKPYINAIGEAVFEGNVKALMLLLAMQMDRLKNHPNQFKLTPYQKVVQRKADENVNAEIDSTWTSFMNVLKPEDAAEVLNTLLADTKNNKIIIPKAKAFDLIAQAGLVQAGKKQTDNEKMTVVEKMSAIT